MTYRANQLTVDLPQIRRNTALIRRELAPGTLLIAVVKADAYGHGAVACAPAMLAGGADMLAVAMIEEALELRRAGIAAPILVLGPPAPEGFDECARLDLAVTAYDRPTLEALNRAGRAAGKPVAAHLKIDTGMARIGERDGEQVRGLIQYARSLPFLRLEGLYTHFADADEAEDAYTALQQQRLEDVLKGIDLPGVTCHAANSAATLRYPGVHYGGVRCGLALYGCAPAACGLPIRPAQRWTCRAAMVKTLPPGEGVSYGTTFTTQRPTRVMTLPVGYADGYRRALSNLGQVLVRGRRAPLIGRVCMDLCMADVTDIPQAQAGDEVVLLGAQGEDCISPGEMAGWLSTIPYEVMLAPSGRVPRVYIGEGT